MSQAKRSKQDDADIARLRRLFAGLGAEDRATYLAYLRRTVARVEEERRAREMEPSR